MKKEYRMMQKVKSENVSSSHLLELILPFYLLLAPYKVGVISANTVLLLFAAFTSIMSAGYKVRWEKKYYFYALFLGYAVIKDIIRIIYNTGSIDSQLNRVIEYVVIYFLVFASCNHTLDEEKLYKTWRIAGTFYIIGLIYHIVQLYILGKTITPISLVPGFQLRPDNLVGSTRPSSFFSEPSAFAWAMIPLEFISLRRKDIKWAVISTLSILACTSTVGIVLSVVLWVSSFIRRDMKTRVKFAMVVGGTAIVVAFLYFPVFFSAYSKLLQVTEGGSTLGSRVIVGFQVIGAMNPIEWVFGSLYSEATQFVANNLSRLESGSVALLYFGVNRLFLNTFSQIIFNYGIVGLLLFVAPLRRYLMSKDYAAKPLIIMVLFAIFGETMLLNSYYFVFVMLSLLYCELQNNSVEKVEQVL